MWSMRTLPVEHQNIHHRGFSRSLDARRKSRRKRFAEAWVPSVYQRYAQICVGVLVVSEHSLLTQLISCHQVRILCVQRLGLALSHT